MARHSSRCLLFAFQLRRSGVEVAKCVWENVSRGMWKKRRFNSKDDESFGCTEKVLRGSESKESLDENPTQKNWKESNICRIWFAYLIKISNLEKRRGKNFKFYALLYFQDNDAIIKNSTCIPFSKEKPRLRGFWCNRIWNLGKKELICTPNVY